MLVQSAVAGGRREVFVGAEEPALCFWIIGAFDMSC